MSHHDHHCPKCHLRIEHHSHDHHVQHGHHDHTCNCAHHEDIYCDRFLCDDNFRINLGGLQGNFAFRIRQLIGCPVKLKIDGEDEISVIICYVGSDWFEAKVLFEDPPPEPHNEEHTLETEQQTTEIKQNALMQKGPKLADDNKQEEMKKKKRIRHKKTQARIIPFRSVKWFEVEDICHDCYED